MNASQLRGLPLFDGLTSDELEACAGQFEEIEVLAGGGMIREGDYSYKFFVVVEGSVDVLRDFVPVATLGPGEYFGEMGVVTGDKRNARVVAKQRCIVGRLMTWDLRQLMDEYPSIGAHIQATIDERARPEGGSDA
jgi:CRP/FNR family cyclic AMP-dependent transcriptional regulator